MSDETTIIDADGERQEVILLFSGGRDSFLAACVLVEAGFRLCMITFENGSGLRPENAAHGVERLQQRYGENTIKWEGVANIVPFWREFFLPYYNLTPSEVVKQYGELPVSQFHCLTCRMAMYIWTIIRAQQEHIRILAEGARQSQSFIVQLPSYMNQLKALLKEYDLELELPVFALESDREMKNQLLLRGFVPKVLEPQCLIGVPLPAEGLSEKIEKAASRFFEQIIAPRVRTLVANNLATPLETNLDHL